MRHRQEKIGPDRPYADRDSTKYVELQWTEANQHRQLTLLTIYSVLRTGGTDRIGGFNVRSQEKGWQRYPENEPSLNMLNTLIQYSLCA